ncbi:MAG: hypothetical protein RML95_05170 [Anaerolineae bacterium]|nr:hypothetical protein [Anaerolineae bacterium]MDW8298708.1 hypothetical protein [Anaerolineae bacterium]
MATPEERMKILDMIREGKIKPDEGARLLQALQQSAQKAEKARDPRWLRVRVMDLQTERIKVNVNLPMSVVNVGLKLGARFVPNSEVDFAALMQAIKEGQVGKVLELVNHEEGERVEVWIE